MPPPPSPNTTPPKKGASPSCVGDNAADALGEQRRQERHAAVEVHVEYERVDGNSVCTGYARRGRGSKSAGGGGGGGGGHTGAHIKLVG